MQSFLLPLALLASTLAGFGADTQASPSGEKKGPSPVCLTANQLSIATGQPSLVLMSSGSVHIPVWSLSGGTVGQSVAGLVSGLPSTCAAVKVEIVVTTTDATTSPQFEDVYRVHLSQMVEGASFTDRLVQGTPVRTTLPAAPFVTRTIVLESYYELLPGAPLWVRIQREPGDPADTWTHPIGLAMVKVTPVEAPAKPHVVQEGGGYNSWPMMQAIGDKLVCVYTRGKEHTIGEGSRDAYARTSSDGGKTWTAETVVANSPDYGEVPVGKGLDADGAMLLWLRRVGKGFHHDLYRTTDGVTFTLVSTPKLAPAPMQITDVFTVPSVGLMALWFAGDYSEGPKSSWGTMTSSDNGTTWSQATVESGLVRSDWPTEPAAVHLGEGKILVIARTERGDGTTGRSQFQITSTDHGKTWTRTKTNIGDVQASTSSFILDHKTGLLSLYYYHRGRGVLRRRVVDPKFVFDHPLNWPISEAVATGSEIPYDAGNVNATVIGDRHYLSFYSGKAPETAVLVSALPAPDGGKSSTTPPHASQQDKEP